MVRVFNCRARRYPHDYWMLHEGDVLRASSLRDELQRRNFTLMKSTTDKVRLRALYARCQRGLMSYEGLSTDELKLYVAQRALPPIIRQKKTVKVLKAQLEQADEGTTFGRFSDLPPEIRRMIYDLHFRSLDSYASNYKYQPPITIASRHIRDESLPLFYECCEFAVATSSNLHLQQRFNLALVTRARDFIGVTSAQNFARIRMMRINSLELGIDLRMDLTNKEDPIDIIWYDKSHYPDNPVHQKRIDRLAAELPKIGLRIAAREGPLKLRESDLDLLHGTSWDTLRNGGQ